MLSRVARKRIGVGSDTPDSNLALKVWLDHSDIVGDRPKSQKRRSTLRGCGSSVGDSESDI